MKLRPVIEFDKGNTGNVKKINDDTMSVNCDVIVFFQFMVNLEQSGSQMPNAWSVQKLKPELKNL